MGVRVDEMMVGLLILQAGYEEPSYAPYGNGKHTKLRHAAAEANGIT